jgi:hypothetical protein
MKMLSRGAFFLIANHEHAKVREILGHPMWERHLKTRVVEPSASSPASDTRQSSSFLDTTDYARRVSEVLSNTGRSAEEYTRTAENSWGQVVWTEGCAAVLLAYRQYSSLNTANMLQDLDSLVMADGGVRVVLDTQGL